MLVFAVLFVLKTNFVVYVCCHYASVSLVTHTRTHTQALASINIMAMTMGAIALAFAPGHDDNFATITKQYAFGMHSRTFRRTGPSTY